MRPSQSTESFKTATSSIRQSPSVDFLNSLDRRPVPSARMSLDLDRHSVSNVSMDSGNTDSQHSRQSLDINRRITRNLAKSGSKLAPEMTVEKITSRIEELGILRKRETDLDSSLIDEITDYILEVMDCVGFVVGT
jgi:hypothetical protein